MHHDSIGTMPVSAHIPGHPTHALAAHPLMPKECARLECHLTSAIAMHPESVPLHHNPMHAQHTLRVALTAIVVTKHV